MVALAQKYCKGDVLRNELFEERNKMATSRGIVKQQPEAQRPRPAVPGSVAVGHGEQEAPTTPIRGVAAIPSEGQSSEDDGFEEPGLSLVEQMMRGLA